MNVDEAGHLIHNGWRRSIEVLKNLVNNCSDVRTFWYASKWHSCAESNICGGGVHVTTKEIWLFIEA